MCIPGMVLTLVKHSNPLSNYLYHFQAAICSPAFKVREFSYVDACPYSISLHWKPTDELMDAVKDDDASEVARGSSMEVFKYLSSIPASKQLRFYRKSNFTLTASYSHSDGLHIANPLIGTFTITEVIPTPPDNIAQVRLKARVNSNGIFTISNAVVMQRVEKEVEVPIEEPKAEASVDVNTKEDKMETDTQEQKVEEASDRPAPADTSVPTPPAPAKPATRIEKKVVLRPRDIPVEAITSQLSNEQLLEFSDFHVGICHDL